MPHRRLNRLFPLPRDSRGDNRDRDHEHASDKRGESHDTSGIARAVHSRGWLLRDRGIHRHAEFLQILQTHTYTYNYIILHFKTPAQVSFSK
jgi:hypothetical protein